MYKRTGESAADYLERIPTFGGKKIPLDQVREFLALLGHPDRDFKIFHVAGTNGKGSVCACLTAVLLEALKTCGTFTSPHLMDIKERFMINGVNATEKQFEDAFDVVYDASCRWMEMGHRHPTYFEYLFYMALVMFQQAGVEYAVLETGMGGRYDVTNVIEHPLCSVITSISIDHTAYLGSTIPEIAGHKAGIIKEGIPVIFDANSDEASAVILANAKEKNAPAYAVSHVPFEREEDRIRIHCSYLGKEESILLPFTAPYQADNGSLAIKALEHSGLFISPETLKNGLLKAYWPARMEKIARGVYLDGAHNEGGISAFLKASASLKEVLHPERTILMFAVASDKDFETMLGRLGTVLRPDLCFLTKVDSLRALPVDELREAAGKAFPSETEVICCDNVKEAVKAVHREKKETDLVLIAGSLYLAGEVKKEM